MLAAAKLVSSPAASALKYHGGTGVGRLSGLGVVYLPSDPFSLSQIRNISVAIDPILLTSQCLMYVKIADDIQQF